jgi:hypothetical protein
MATVAIDGVGGCCGGSDIVKMTRWQRQWQRHFNAVADVSCEATGQWMMVAVGGGGNKDCI